ncbi:MAG: nad3 [Haloplasmataceae bacterium]|jgi:NADH:ubiquinone oxidoreductase subunit 3 (subunit A)|nr:nad3 [Haloplasmataceae bacterium]
MKKILNENINSFYPMGNTYYYYNEYSNFFFYFFVLLGVSFLILALCYIITIKNPYNEKNSGYECGFDPFSDAREPFYVKFYLISILFIIFDVEVVFFFPWAISFKQLFFFGYYIMYIFIIILIIGFVYEWKKGSLDWD